LTHVTNDLAISLADADAALDRAWSAGAGVGTALAHARRLSCEVGRDPSIEDAKVTLAEATGCTPSEAFELLRIFSQRTNRKVSNVARSIVGNREGGLSAP
jgi:AmiR/NasT family two-component response regulator